MVAERSKTESKPHLIVISTSMRFTSLRSITTMQYYCWGHIKILMMVAERSKTESKPHLCFE